MSQDDKLEKVAFGDFQTPATLAEQVCHLLQRSGLSPNSILEPTCGLGSFLLAATTTFPNAKHFMGFDINESYIHLVQQQPFYETNKDRIQLSQGNFFSLDWATIIQNVPDPLLIIGNPPWVTNSTLATLNSSNLPAKSNFQNRAGIEAITGASNFDISEWMLRQMVVWLDGRNGMLAMLCKTAVARKLLMYLWENNRQFSTSLHLIDAQEAFQASVDACLFVADTRTKAERKICDIYPNLEITNPIAQIGFERGQLIANMHYFHQWEHLLLTGSSPYQWRSGIKHDCAQVMELQRIDGRFTNKLGQNFSLENDYLYPMLKSSEIVNGTTTRPYRYMLVTQKTVGEDTKDIQLTAPQTWSYLQTHGVYLDGRKSRIYKNRPRFSIFGVGGYSFAPWKVAVSGLYKHLQFSAIGPYQNKPIVLDDTCYFIPCQSEDEAQFLTQLLNSNTARQFFYSFIFWDTKRPVTIKILQRLDLFALAKELDQLPHLKSILSTKQTASNFQQLQLQLQLLEAKSDYAP